MECDAQKKVYVYDSDGSLTNNKVAVYIIPQADRAWGKADELYRGLGDFAIPREMQTDINGKRIPMDTVRPHTGIFM